MLGRALDTTIHSKVAGPQPQTRPHVKPRSERRRADVALSELGPSSLQPVALAEALPPELVDAIFDQLVSGASVRFIVSTLLPLSSKTYNLLLPRLYAYPILASSHSMQCFARTLRASSHLGLLVHGIFLRSDVWMGGANENDVVSILKSIPNARDIELGPLESTLVTFIPDDTSVERLTLQAGARDSDDDEPHIGARGGPWRRRLKRLEMLQSYDEAEDDNLSMKDLDSCLEVTFKGELGGLTFSCNRPGGIAAGWPETLTLHKLPHVFEHHMVRDEQRSTRLGLFHTALHFRRVTLCSKIAEGTVDAEAMQRCISQDLADILQRHLEASPAYDALRRVSDEPFRFNMRLTEGKHLIDSRVRIDDFKQRHSL
ncbi:hypothetical protein ACQY0O_003788 [Thecaphora frezii]